MSYQVLEIFSNYFFKHSFYNFLFFLLLRLTKCMMTYLTVSYKSLRLNSLYSYFLLCILNNFNCLVLKFADSSFCQFNLILNSSSEFVLFQVLYILTQNLCLVPFHNFLYFLVFTLLSNIIFLTSVSSFLMTSISPMSMFITIKILG